MARAPTARASRTCLTLSASLTALLAAGVAGPCLMATSPAAAQAWVGVPAKRAGSVPTASSTLSQGRADPNSQMFVQADQIDYDYTGEQVAAVGKVQIHYNGSIVEADRITYNQRTKRLVAEGGVRLTEADGKVISAERLDLDDKLRDGFVDSLHVETYDKTRLAAARADFLPDREEGRLTVFQSGVYTACEPCIENPQRPPKWQVKAARIVHSEIDKTIYFEDFRFELFGLPIVYLPYMWTPDPTVKRQSGFLSPHFFSTTYIGYGVQVPFYWALAPDYDVTFMPMPTTKQGLVMVGEWRQRLINGAYTVRAAGVFQEDRSAFVGTTGDRAFRGAIETRGDFRLAENWWYGWDASLFTDNSFSPQYKVTRQGSEVVSQFYLFGRGATSYFDARALHFYGFSPVDVQKQLPILHPLIDYRYKYADPIFGGEVTYNFNLTSLTRQQADYDPRTSAVRDKVLDDRGVWLFSDGKNACDSADPAALKTRDKCLLRGIAGTYTRLSGDVQWRKSIIDSFGQIFTPFVYLRADVASLALSPDASMANFIDPNTNSLARVMPAVGLEYRYPFLSVHSWGSQTLEPVAQVILRPNESQIGRFPNEDSQSLMFDDANLFSINKFSGWDRVEGGGRANVGLQYTAQFNKAGYLNAVFGQSYQLFGRNSYATPDLAYTGQDSGLDTNRSDYVGRITYQPNSTYALLSRFRLDENNFSAHRVELEGRVMFERWTASMTYGRYDAQPSSALFLAREGILPSATFKVTPNWTLSASALYSIDSSRLNASTLSVGYIDECIALNLSYSTSYGYQGNVAPTHTVLFRLNLRTLGGTTGSPNPTILNNNLAGGYGL